MNRKDRRDVYMFVGFLVVVGSLLAVVILSRSGWSDSRWTAVAAIATAAQAIGLIAALLIAWRSHQTEIDAVAVDRVLTLQATLVEGEIGAARSRLSTHLRDIVASRDGPDVRGRYQPVPRDLSNFGGMWGVYSPRVINPEGAVPAQDLNRLLWCFERLAGAQAHGLVDEALFHRLIGPHAIWWRHALVNYDPAAIRAINSLDQLAGWVREYRRQHPETEEHMVLVDALVLKDFGLAEPSSPGSM